MSHDPTFAPLLMRCGQSGAAMRWDARACRWRWLDPLSGLLYVLTDDCATYQVIRLQEHANVIACCASGRILLGLGKRLGIVELPAASGAGRPLQAQVLATIDPAEPRTVISDGCTDRHGYFVFGSSNIAADQRPIGSFYQYSQRYGLRRLALPAVATAAGIVFSADGRYMYFSDAAIGDIMRCRYDAERASVSDVQVFARGVVGACAALVDAADQVWSTQGRMLCQHDGDGVVRQTTAIADQALAGAALGGSRLDQLLMLGVDGGIFRAPPATDMPAMAGLADTPFDDVHAAVSVLRASAAW